MTKAEKEHFKGTVMRFTENRGEIMADDGDWYGFKSKRLFQVGDRVSFDAYQSGANLSRAMMGEPIACINVKRSKGEKGMGVIPDVTRNPNDRVNIFITYGSPDSVSGD